ncbi:MAG: TrkH family potassium uptake protein [Betaproteobacteria bacterium]|nr:TrkH family potassium uptake protein [Betaproteobacteria bacterium]
MNWFLSIAPLLGVIAMGMSLSHLVPIACSLLLGDGTARLFLLSLAVNFFAGLLVWVATRRYRREIGIREGILLVVLVWSGGAFFATLPLLLVIPGLSFTDAFFEAVSGLTATGATVLTGLDDLPPSINLWRGLLQWLGGMGVIVLAVAILPLLGVGGRQLFKSEIPGPMKEEQLTPRITETAKGLWLVYALLTLACMLAYRAAGMSWFDAVMHSFTTMALGGFSSHDASFGYFNSPLIEGIAVSFMLIAGINFATHFMAWRGRSPSSYLRDPEARVFLSMAVASVLAVAAFLWTRGVYPDFATALRYAAFNVISVGTTTGYSTTDYNLWPVFAPLWILFLGTFLSSSGSTGGGVKMIRAMVLFRQVYREFSRLAHPGAIVPLKISGMPISAQVIFAVLAFFFAWIAALVTMTLVLAATGLDAMTAFSAVVATLSNIGPGLQEVGPAASYATLTDFQTWVLAFAMLLGRLELFTLLIVFTPAFWRR